MNKNVKYVDLHDPSSKKYLMQDEYIKNNLNHFMEFQNGELIIDVDRDVPVGRICVWNEKNKKNTGFINSLYIDEDYRGNGFGNQLLKDAINNYGGYDLCVHKDNKIALNMYKKYGFVEDASRTKKDMKYMILKNRYNNVIESFNDYCDELKISDNNINNLSLESSFKSKIDDDFKLKGKKSLSEFKKVKIDDTFMKKYTKTTKLLKYADSSEFGFAWMDGSKLVGYCMNNPWGWITAIELSNEYKGYGLGRQLLKYAMTNMGGNRLGVHDDNQVAIKLYKSMGFKEVPSKAINGSGEKNMIFMTTDKSVLNSLKIQKQERNDNMKESAIENFIDYCDDMMIAEEGIIGTGIAIAAAGAITLGFIVSKVNKALDKRRKVTIDAFVDFDKIKYISYDERIIPIFKNLMKEYKDYANRNFKIWDEIVKIDDKRDYGNKKAIDKLEDKLDKLSSEITSTNKNYLSKIIPIKENPIWVNNGDKNLIKPMIKDLEEVIDGFYDVIGTTNSGHDDCVKLKNNDDYEIGDFTPLIQKCISIYDEDINDYRGPLIMCLELIKIQYKGKEKKL